VDTSTEGFLHHNDPALLAYNDFRDQFGRDEAVIIALKPDKVFDLEFLATLKRLHEDLEENVPYIDDITSLINARNTRGEGDQLIVEDLLEAWPKNQAQLPVIRQRAMSNPMYRNMLLSADGTFTTIVIRTQSYSTAGESLDVMAGFEEEFSKTAESLETPYLSDAENTEVVAAVNEVIARYRSDDLTIQLAGSPVVTHFLKQSLMGDLGKFMRMAIATICVVLYIMFRRITGVILPLLIVTLSFLCTLGLMGLTGVAFKVPTQILPSFILAVGVGTAVHILAIFYHRLREKHDQREAIAHALGHSGLAVVMTNLTTAAGLMSFATADIAPVAELGIFAGLGIILAFIFTIFLVPALLAIIPISAAKSAQQRQKSNLMDALLRKFARFATTHPMKILLVSAVIIVIAVAGITQIRLSHAPLEWFPNDNAIRRASESIDKELRGSITMEVVLDTKRENGLHDPNLLHRMDKAGQYLEGLKTDGLFVGKAWSMTTILKETNKALNEGNPEAYIIPRDKELVAQELLLFENSGSDDLEDFVDSRFSKARLTLKLPFLDAVKYRPLLVLVTDYFSEHFKDIGFEFTGMMYLFAQILNNTISSMFKSYAIALVVITLLMMLLIGKVRIGLLSMVPNLFPIFITLGIIGWLSLRMDLFTMMVASIAIGLAVDDTIHFMHNFRRYYEISGDPTRAVYETLHTTGRAMLVTSVVLSLGFFIFGFATMSNIINFGILTGITIILALMSDYLVAPALMVLVNKKVAATAPLETSSAAAMQSMVKE
jgi:predicted RND superfamily exporter protein